MAHFYKKNNRIDRVEIIILNLNTSISLTNFTEFQKVEAFLNKNKHVVFYVFKISNNNFGNMSTIHRPGNLKQSNKPHNSGRHRSKGMIHAEAKGIFNLYTYFYKIH